MLFCLVTPTELAVAAVVVFPASFTDVERDDFRSIRRRLVPIGGNGGGVGLEGAAADDDDERGSGVVTDGDGLEAATPEVRGGGGGPMGRGILRRSSV